MFFRLISTRPLMCGIYAITVAMAMLLAGCSSPDFANPPPDAYLSPLPAAINGTWANEVENGERVRLSGQKDGTLKLYFSNTKPNAEPTPEEPLLAQTLRFDNTDWILLDFRKLAEWQKGDPYTDHSPYRLIKYVLENPDRLCGIEMNPAVFAEAVKSGKLEGTVVAPPPRMPQPPRVTITSPGEDWVKWWIAQPEDKKSFGHSWCFTRAK